MAGANRALASDDRGQRPDRPAAQVPPPKGSERGRGEDELFELCSPDPDPSVGIDDDEELWLGGQPYGKQWLLAMIHGILADSSEMDREVLLAYYSARGGSCNVLSERLGVQAGVVKVRLYRARRRLRRRCWERLFGKQELPQEGQALSTGARGTEVAA